MNGVIYARYSEGPRQTDQSIEGQVADCTAYAERNGIDIVGLYADRGISGKSAENRAEFQKMIRDAAAGKFQVVIVWKVDRFGRNRQDIAFNKYKLKKAGVKLMYAEESVPDGPEGIILESVLEGMAEYYSADLRQKVIRGRRETLKKGLYCGAPLPLGYKVDEERHIQIDEEVAPAIREVFRMYASGTGVNDLVDYLNKLGITGRRGGRISPAVIYRMLRNERYLGIFDTDGVELRAEPLIDEATFRACEDYFRPLHQNAAGRANVDYKLSCKCFCAYCGAMLVGESGTGKKGKVYHYYKCGKKKRGSKCKLKPVRKDVLEEAVLKATMEDMLTDETIAALVDEILRIQDQEAEADPAAALRKQLDSNRKRQRNLLDAIEEGTGAKGLAARLADLEAEEHDLVVEIEKAELQQPRISHEDITAWLCSFRGGDIEDPEFAARLIDTFVAKVEVKNGMAAIYYNIRKGGHKKTTDRSRVRIRSVEWGSRSLIRTRKPFVHDGYIVLLIAV